MSIEFIEINRTRIVAEQDGKRIGNIFFNEETERWLYQENNGDRPLGSNESLDLLKLAIIAYYEPGEGNDPELTVAQQAIEALLLTEVSRSQLFSAIEAYNESLKALGEAMSEETNGWGYVNIVEHEGELWKIEAYEDMWDVDKGHPPNITLIKIDGKRPGGAA